MGALEYRIHPSVGVARMGDSPTHFFTGAEDPTSRREPLLRTIDDLQDTDGSDDERRSWRDPLGRIAKQAARFRVFEYRWDDADEGGPPTQVREVTPDVADLKWTVEVANRKGGTSSPNAPGMRSLDTRDDSQVRTRLSLATGQRLTLGSILIEPDSTALLVLGSDGTARPSSNDDDGPGPSWLEHNPPLDADDSAILGLDRVVNAGWEDDAADGRVSVEVFPKEGGDPEAPVRSSWVVIAPPDYGADAEHVVRLYDVALDHAQSADRLLPHRERRLRSAPDATRDDVRRQLRAILDLRWVSDHEPSAIVTGGDSAEPTTDDVDDLLGATRAVRSELLASVRPPLRTFGGIHRWYRESDPSLRERLESLRLRPTEDDPGGRELPYARWHTFPRLAHRWLSAWIDDETLVDDPFSGELARPRQLDEAHLGSMSGGPFLPGIEVGFEASRLHRWEARPGAHEGHVDIRFRGEPGDLTYDLAVPWQVTFQRDAQRWWPSSRPVTVRRAATGATDVEVRPWDHDDDGRRMDVLTRWAELPFLQRQDDGSLQEHDRGDGELTAPATHWIPHGAISPARAAREVNWYRDHRVARTTFRGLDDDDRRLVLNVLGLGPEDLVIEDVDATDAPIIVSEKFVLRVAGFQSIQTTAIGTDGRLGPTSLGRLRLGSDPARTTGWNVARVAHDEPDPRFAEEVTAGSVVALVVDLLGDEGRRHRPTDLHDVDGAITLGASGIIDGFDVPLATLLDRVHATEADAIASRFSVGEGGAVSAVMDALVPDGGSPSLPLMASSAAFGELAAIIADPVAVRAQLALLEEALEPGSGAMIQGAPRLPTFGSVALSWLRADPTPADAALDGTAHGLLRAERELVGLIAGASVSSELANVASEYASRLFDYHVAAPHMDELSPLVPWSGLYPADAEGNRPVPYPSWSEVFRQVMPPGPWEIPDNPSDLARLERVLSVVAPIWALTWDPEVDVYAAIADAGGPSRVRFEDVELTQAPLAEKVATARAWPHATAYDEWLGETDDDGNFVRQPPLAGMARTWDGMLEQMYRMEWFGQQVDGHRLLLERLHQARNELSSSVDYVRSMGDRSHWREINRCLRSCNRDCAEGFGDWCCHRNSLSYHYFGMAVDVDAARNPWLAVPGNGRTTLQRRQEDHWIIWRAVWLMGGADPVSPVDSDQRVGRAGRRETTRELWAHFDAASRAVVRYFALGDRAGVAAHLARRDLPDPPGFRPADGAGVYPYRPVEDDLADEPLETDNDPEAAIERLGNLDAAGWHGVIERDRTAIEGKPELQPKSRSSSGGLTTGHGFMNLREDFVVAMRDVARLGWGGCDFGRDMNGDFMHFDLRNPNRAADGDPRVGPFGALRGALRDRREVRAD